MKMQNIVEVAFEFVNIGEIDTIKQIFEAEIIIESKWATIENFVQYDPKENWNPSLYVENAGMVKERITYEVCSEKYIIYVTEIRIIKGTFWKRMNFKNFPFDVQQLDIILTSKLGSDKIHLISDVHKLSYFDFEAKQNFKDKQRWDLFRLVTTSDTTKCSTCFEYDKVSGPKKEPLIKIKTCRQGSCKKTIIKDIIIARKDIRPPKLAASCYAARRPGFFIINGFFINFLITIMSLTVYSIENTTPQYRLQSSFTILLSAISLKWTIINRSLPSISYLTLLDAYQILSIFFICLNSAWHALDSSFFHKYQLDNAMLSIFFTLFLIQHLVFLIWIYKINEKKRELFREERNYFAKHKEHFIPCDKI